jgi:hypothetical protein
LKNVRKRRKEGMRRRHIRVMAKMRLSDLIRSEDARTGRKNVTTVAGMVGASALGSLIFWVANAYADSFSFGVCCPPGQTPSVSCRDYYATLFCNGVEQKPRVDCPYGWSIICGPRFSQSCYAFTCYNN